MKKRLFCILLILLLVLTACKPSLEKGKELLSDKKYEEAIEIFNQLLDEDETNYDAWFGIIKSQIKDDEYDDAEDTLEDLLDVVTDNYDEDDENVDYEDVIDEIQDFAEDIIDEEGEIGDWYTELQPQMIDLWDIDYGTYGVDEILTLPVPDKGDVYYNLKGKRVTTKDDKYKEGIKLNETGEFELVVAMINELGMKGEETRAYITVIDKQAAPTVDYDGGTYEAPLYLDFYDYDPDQGDLYYSLDGSDPEYGYYYWPGESVELYAGEYTLRAAVLDYETGEYSKELTVEYIVEGETAPSSSSSVGSEVELDIVVFDVSDNVYSEVEYVAEDVEWYFDNININVSSVSSFDDLYELCESGNVPDAVYTWAGYASDLYEYIGDITQIVDVSYYDYYDSVLESTYYYDAYYCLPVTVKPQQILYYNYYDTYDEYDYGITYDEFIYEAQNSTVDYGLAYIPTDIISLIAFYTGFGGNVSSEYGYIELDYEPLVNALQYSRDLVSDGLVDSNISQYDYAMALQDGDATFIISSPNIYSDFDYYDNYFPVGAFPLSNGNYAKYPLSVEGLMVDYNITLDPYGDKAQAIALLYDYMANDSLYNGYIASANRAMPAVKSILNEYDYDTLFDIYTYEEILANCSAFSNDLMEAAVYFVDFESIINDVLVGNITPEDGANIIIQEIEAMYY